jgi:hypothetical protein
VVVSARWVRITRPVATAAVIGLVLALAPPEPLRALAGQSPPVAAEDTAATTPIVVAGAESTADVGVVAVGADARYEFSVRNDSSEPLTLRPARVAAEAAITALDERIAPGARGRVHVALDTFALAGPNEVAVVLASSDPGRPEIRLTLRIDVRSFIVVDPGFARYLFVQGAREGTIAQSLWASDGTPFRVIGVRSPSPHLRVRVREARADERTQAASGRQWRVESTLASRPPVGPLGGFIELTLDHPRQQRVRIPVSGFVRPMLAVTPPAGDLGEVRAGTAVRGRFVLKNFAEENVSVAHVRADVAGVAADVITVEPGHVYTVGLAIAADAPPGPFSGRIRIRTSSAKTRDVDVPIHGTIVGPAGAATSKAEPVP